MEDLIIHTGGEDCGLFSVPHAVTACHDGNPSDSYASWARAPAGCYCPQIRLGNLSLLRSKPRRGLWGRQTHSCVEESLPCWPRFPVSEPRC